MLRGLGKLALCAVLMLALGSFAAQTALAGCGGCSKCSAKKSCGCKKDKCGCKKSCGCLPNFCADPGVSGYSLDLSCADACCFKKPCETEVCIDGWDLCKKWCDGKIHHPYELTFNGHGMLCDTGCCSAYIPFPRRGVMCRTECKEHKDNCGCTQCCAETTCEDITRPRVIPWWFNPGHGNTYLDADGNPVCGQTMPPKDVPPVTPPVIDTPPIAPPTPLEPPTPPEPPAPPEDTTVLPPEGGKG